MQTLVPIGTFEEKARKLIGNAGFDDLLEFLASLRADPLPNDPLDRAAASQ